MCAKMCNRWIIFFCFARLFAEYYNQMEIVSEKSWVVSWFIADVKYFSLQNKIWNLPDRCTILPKFVYGKEEKLVGPTQVLPVKVHGPTLILKTGTFVTKHWPPVHMTTDERFMSYVYFLSWLIVYIGKMLVWAALTGVTTTTSEWSTISLPTKVWLIL